MSEISSPVSPMMAQYHDVKRAHPGCMLFYRMGDFYELFFDDAVAASKVLNIALTKRGRHEGEDIPMCGVPVHSHESYLQRLIRHGFRVAICEQLEDPAEARKRGGKAVVKRDVIRIVTPGTITEDSLLDARSANYLGALAEAGGGLGLGWLDLSTGAVTLQPVAAVGQILSMAIARLDPQELLVSEKLIQRSELFEWLGEWKDRLSVQSNSLFDSENGRLRLQTLYGVGTLDAFGAFERAEIAAAGALVAYIDLTQKGKVPRLQPPRRVSPGSAMDIDAATRRNLELTRTLSGERRGSLLSAIDRTVFGPGARLLADRLAAPLTDVVAIDERLDLVEFFVREERLRVDIRAALKATPDLERAMSRLSLGRGGPRDAAAVRDALIQAENMREVLSPFSETAPLDLRRLTRNLGEHSTLVQRLSAALASELPILTRDGGFIARGYSLPLDELVMLRDEGKRLIAGLQARYSADTGVNSLKIKFNNVLGYHIEVSAVQADKLMTGARRETFIHRQTTANAVRFSTVELADLERKISEAGDRALAIELELFAVLTTEIAGRAETLLPTAQALAELDVAAALAELAVERAYCRPQISDDLAFEIRKGRHPVVEAALEEAGDSRFVANDCDLGPERRLWLLTGPNMAGKSTFLRQNALIAIMAQMGAFVPAEAVRLGVVDRLFSRVGAADDLARGRSTFMVEMVETAAILNQAGLRALVILDEIGRGTATFDGLSIAWACVEHLHEHIGCRGLFATHYHELTMLASKLRHLACHTMRIKEWSGDVVFLHEVAVGSADRSYGVHVARLAGLPSAVVARAEQVLKILETGEKAAGVARLAEDLPLFQAAARPVAAASVARVSEVEKTLADLNPDDMTPRAALEALYRLRSLLPKNK
ncbi:DNA mismatch repair protein MutS [Azospirillaceae bacterium]